MVETNTTGPFPWKDFPAIALAVPMQLLRCQNCGEHGLRPGEAAALDRAIEESIKIYTHGLIETILLREECSQVALATRLGVTQEYISYLKNGTKLPSYQTFNLLRLVALVRGSFRALDDTIDQNLINARSA